MWSAWSKSHLCWRRDFDVLDGWTGADCGRKVGFAVLNHRWALTYLLSSCLYWTDWRKVDDYSSLVSSLYHPGSVRNNLAATDHLGRMGSSWEIQTTVIGRSFYYFLEYEWHLSFLQTHDNQLASWFGRSYCETDLFRNRHVLLTHCLLAKASKTIKVLSQWCHWWNHLGNLHQT